jgi:hypothetical protein
MKAEGWAILDTRYGHIVDFQDDHDEAVFQMNLIGTDSKAEPGGLEVLACTRALKNAGEGHPGRFRIVNSVACMPEEAEAEDREAKSRGAHR